MMNKLRTVTGAIKFARRVDPHSIPVTQSLQAKQGIRYEKRVARALCLFAQQRGYEIEIGPWYTFADDEGEALCVPDIVLDHGDSATLTALEIKLTYTPLALKKLSALYRPVIEAATGKQCRIITVCKHMTAGAPHAAYTMAEALRAREPVMQWLGHGAFPG